MLFLATEDIEFRTKSDFSRLRPSHLIVECYKLRLKEGELHTPAKDNLLNLKKLSYSS